jgi:hypothetical protein
MPPSTALFFEALVAEHQPSGPTEEHLVEELAGILWRKRRLRLAEAAAIRQGLPDATISSRCRWTAERAMAHLRASATGEELVEAVQATPEDTASDLAALAADEAQMLQAIAMLKAGGKRAYNRALALGGWGRLFHEGSSYSVAPADHKLGHASGPLAPTGG